MNLMPRFLTALSALAFTGLALAQSDEITYNTHVAPVSYTHLTLPTIA